MVQKDGRFGLSCLSTMGLAHLLQEVDRVYPAFLSRPQGPMIRLLATTAPLAMFIGTNPLHLSIATRIAHDLYTYHRIDTQIISPATDSTSLGPSTFEGNHLIIGRPEDNVWVKALLAESVSQSEFHPRASAQVLIQPNSRSVQARQYHLQRPLHRREGCRYVRFL